MNKKELDEKQYRIAQRVFAHYEPDQAEDCKFCCCCTNEDLDDALMITDEIGLWYCLSEFVEQMPDFENDSDDDIYNLTVAAFDELGGIVYLFDWKHIDEMLEGTGLTQYDLWEDYFFYVAEAEDGRPVKWIANRIKSENAERERREAWERKKEQLAAEAQAPREKPVRMYKGKPLHNRNY